MMDYTDTDELDEHEVAGAIRELLTESGDGIAEKVAGVSTFDEAGVLTRNAGLVVRLDDGTEFQVTVVRSR